MRAKAILAVMFAFMFFGAQSYAAPAPQSIPEMKQAFNSGKKTLLFFLNPNGRPCQAQDEILKKLHSDRKQGFNLVYVSVMQRETEKAFYDYGIRGLPSIVIVDSKGNIGQVLPPGIQSYETLVKSLDATK